MGKKLILIFHQFNLIRKQKNQKEQNMPLYISNIDGSEKYIIPLRGTGLWGPIWGYISLDNDMNTVYGAVFDQSRNSWTWR